MEGKRTEKGNQEETEKKKGRGGLRVNGWHALGKGRGEEKDTGREKRANPSLFLSTSGPFIFPLYLTAKMHRIDCIYYFLRRIYLIHVVDSSSFWFLAFLAHMWLFAVRNGRVATWWHWRRCPSLFTQWHSSLHRLSHFHRGVWPSLLPSFSCLGWDTTMQLHIHFTHTASQPCSPSPLLLPCFCSAPSPLYFCSAQPRPPFPSLPETTQMSPLTPAPLPHFVLPSLLLTDRWQVQRRKHKGRRQGWIQIRKVQAKSVKMRGKERGEKQHEIGWNVRWGHWREGGMVFLGGERGMSGEMG